MYKIYKIIYILDCQTLGCDCYIKTHLFQLIPSQNRGLKLRLHFGLIHAA